MGDKTFQVTATEIDHFGIYGKTLPKNNIVKWKPTSSVAQLDVDQRIDKALCPYIVYTDTGTLSELHDMNILGDKTESSNKDTIDQN